MICTAKSVSAFYFLKKRAAILFCIVSFCLGLGSISAQTFNPTFSGRIAAGDGLPPYLQKAADVVVQGNFAYVATGNGLEIVDVSLPAAPVHKGSLRSVDDPAVSRMSQIFVSGNYAYAFSFDNFLVIDISNPAAPKRIGILNFPTNFSIYQLGIYVSGNFAYVTSGVSFEGVGDLLVIDVSTPTSPKLKYGSTPTANPITSFNYSRQKIFANKNYCYRIDGNGLIIYTISNPAQPPANIGYLYDFANLNNAWDLAVAEWGGKTFAFVVQQNEAGKINANTVSVFDVTNPVSPKFLNRITHGTDGANLLDPFSIDILYQGGIHYACVASREGNAVEILNVENVTTTSAPKHVATVNDSPDTPLEGASGIFISGSKAYVASGTSGALQIFDLANPAAPSPVGNIASSPNQISLGTEFYMCAAVSGSYAFVASSFLTGFTYENAIAVVDISDPRNPAFVTNILNGDNGAYLGGPRSQVINGNYLYVANHGNTNKATVQVFNITNPKAPVAAGSYISTNSGRSIAIKGNYAYVLMVNSTNKYTMQVIDISNPNALVLKGAIATTISSLSSDKWADRFSTISVLGNKAYIVANGSLVTIDITTSEVPVIDPSYLSISNASSGVVANIGTRPYAFVTRTNQANGGDFLNIVDLTTTPSSIVKSIPTKYLNGNLSVVNKNNSYYLMLPNYGSSSVDIFDVTVPANASIFKTLTSSNVDAAANLNLTLPYQVTTSGNLAFVSTKNHFEIIDLFGSSIDAIDGFSPKTGSENSTITITGKNFDSFLSVAFNGVNGTVTSYTPTQATVTVPVGATIGKITVTSRGTSRSSNNFLVIPNASAATAIIQPGFTANWSNVGATKYFLDVSTSNTFSSYVTGYNNKDLGNVTASAVTGLTPGTTYYYRVRSNDGSSASGNSNTVTVITIPATPSVATLATSITQSGFTVNWSAVNGVVSNYFLDVATDDAFANFVPGYNNLGVPASNTLQVVSGLNLGTYYARVRSANTSGSSSSSTFITISTLPPNPIATASTSITTNSFIVNWQASAGATGYSIDVSIDNFNTFVTGYANLAVGSASSFIVSGLSPATSYQYRVRASNNSGSSGNSNATSVLTLTPVPSLQPTNLVFSNASENSVTVSFTLASGNPTGYLVLRSLAFPSILPTDAINYTIGTPIGNAIVAYVGPSLSFFDGGLTTATKYYYTMYAFNGTGISTIYRTENPLQGNITLDIAPPTISTTSNPSTITVGNTPNFNAIISDNVGVTAAKIFYRGISQSSFKEAALIGSSGGNYAVQIQTDWYDSLGIEYYFMATDESGNTTTKPASSFAQIVNASISLPALPSGTAQESYRIVSFPYQLTDNKVTSVYNNVPWNDNTKAGLWWWNPTLKNGVGDYDQYGISPTLLTIDPGKGYWAITSSPVTPTLSNVAAPKYNRSNLYSMTLKPGWNQIGNPYPVAISWDDVIAFNQQNNITAFSELTVYDGTGYKSAKGTVLLKPFEGGFVKNLSSSDITIQIPFRGQLSSGGRIASITSDSSQEDWNIFLHINQDDRTNQLGGFGMHRLAQEGIDRYDNFNPPSFLGIPEVSFINAEYPNVSFSNDMVSPQDNYTWTFTPAGKEGSLTQLVWNNEANINSSKQLFLLDEEQLTVVDMNEVDHYDFVLTKGRRFRIFYGSDVKMTSSRIITSAPFPNPLTNESKATIHVALPESASEYAILLQVYTSQGSVIESVNERLTAGIHPLEFIFPSSLGEGIYIYKLAISNEKTSSIRTGKIVKP